MVGGRRNLADRIRPLRRLAGRVEAAEVRWFGRSVLSTVMRQPVLVLETTGRRSGKRRSTPLAYREVDGALVVVGGAGGQTAVPDWVHNLRADPNVVVTRRRRRLPMVAREVEGDERAAILGVASQTGIAAAIADGRATQSAVATRAGVADGELLEAFLELGVALGELRRRGDRFSIRGRRLRAVAGRSPDLKGLVEEVVGFGNVVYEAMGHHLRDGSTDDYLTGFGPIIAEASRVAEPALGPVIRTIAAEVGPTTILDVGCGSGIYLAHALAACPTATGLGIDVDPEVAERAVTPLPPGRGETRHGELSTFDEGPFDLVLLLNNIYYWPPDERPAALGRLRALAPNGTAVVASTVPNGQAFNRHLDLICRVGDGSYRLPTKAELDRDLRTAGFTDVEVTEPVPGLGLVVAIAR